jgi:hypothetical protein
MKNKRFQYAYRNNTSKLHKKVGDLLRENKAFGEFEWYQEYPVNLINNRYPDGRAKLDWVCPAVRIVIECHGKQHYEVVDFGYDTPEEAIEAFHAGKKRDIIKKRAAMDANYVYMVVPYTMEKKVDIAWLHKIFQLQLEELQEHITYNKERIKEEKEQKKNELAEVLKAQKKAKDKELRKQYLESDRHKEQLEKAREYRRQQYKRLKELKRNAQ